LAESSQHARLAVLAATAQLLAPDEWDGPPYGPLTMNPPSLNGFRTSLLNRVRVADREIVRSKKRKNFRAELLKLNALQAIQFLDDYIERASDDEFS